ncbi:MAG: cytochrome c [Burkholderiales bacterium]
MQSGESLAIASKALCGRWMRLALISLLIGSGALHAEEDATNVAAAAVKEKYQIDVKKLFATQCSWCHPAYGMKGADGPKLAGTSKTREQVIQQISTGKSPMPGYRKMLKEEQIQALADYIKALPAN